jgi:hypothetical protein
VGVEKFHKGGKIMQEKQQTQSTNTLFLTKENNRKGHRPDVFSQDELARKKIQAITKQIAKRLKDQYKDEPIKAIPDKKNVGDMVFLCDGIVVGTLRNNKVSIHVKYWKKEKAKRAVRNTNVKNATHYKTQNLLEYTLQILLGQIPRWKYNVKTKRSNDGNTITINFVHKDRKYRDGKGSTITINIQRRHNNKTIITRTNNNDDITTTTLATMQHNNVCFNASSFCINVGELIRESPSLRTVHISEIVKVHQCTLCKIYTMPNPQIQMCCQCYGDLQRTYIITDPKIVPKYTKLQIQKLHQTLQIRKERKQAKQAKFATLPIEEQMDIERTKQIIADMKKEKERMARMKPHITSKPFRLCNTTTKIPYEKEDKEVKPTIYKVLRYNFKLHRVEKIKMDAKDANTSRVCDIITGKTKEGHLLRGIDAIQLLLNGNI